MSDAEAPRSSLILYFTEDGRARIQCRLEGDTIWLTQAQMAELFHVSVPNVNLHLKAIYGERELAPEATIKSYLMVRTEGRRSVNRPVLHYSLPAVLAVGYRVRSPCGTQFRQWATATLADYVVKGFALDDDRLKHPPAADLPDYFDELLERIRDIRASERRMYTRVRDILKLAADYTPTDAETQKAFQVIQNKLHHAVTGMTAAETIAARADVAKPNMGLTTWRGGTVQKADVTVAKNYLHESEIDELNRIVVMFLDFAEDQARRKQQVFLRDWQQKLDEFLRFNERDVLPNAGRVSREQADSRAAAEYEAFAARRRTAAEVQGEADAFQALEDAAKRLPKRTKGKSAKGGDK